MQPLVPLTPCHPVVHADCGYDTRGHVPAAELPGTVFKSDDVLFEVEAPILPLTVEPSDALGPLVAHEPEPPPGAQNAAMAARVLGPTAPQPVEVALPDDTI